MSKPRIILVCGSHKRSDRAYIFQVLDHLSHWFEDNIAILQGGAKHVDHFAKEWATENGHATITMDANWTIFQNRAGPIRNSWMLQFIDVDLVVAFDGDNGTKDMVKKAKAKGIPVYEG